MNKGSIYKEIIQSKDGHAIPLLINGKSIDSRYKAIKSAQTLISEVKENTGFVILFGLSSGLFVEEILKIRKIKILILEINQEDYDFLNQIPLIKNLNKENLIFSTLNTVKEDLINSYLPAIDGNLQIIEQKPWIECNQNFLDEINCKIQDGLKIISQDYSTQAHFGKIWNNNILRNIKLLDYSDKNPLIYNQNKIAAVIAAGPSLDESVKIIEKNREKYLVIACDTAFQALLKRNIFVDFVISIDGQFISHNHFFNHYEGSHFFFDLAADFSSAQLITKSKNNLHFFVSGHPLSNLVNKINSNNFPKLYTGSGTVTIAALDFAIKLGLKKIQIFAADFSYINGKAYTKGTYLDSLYSINSNKIFPMEKEFEQLQFRSPLNKISENKFSSELLKSYKQSFLNYINVLGIKIEFKNDIYHLENIYSRKELFVKSSISSEEILKELSKCGKEELLNPLLPYIAYLRYKDNNSKTFEEYWNLAHTNIVSYN